MPATLKAIGENAFYKCTHLEIKGIPATAKIAPTAFDFCKHKYNIVLKSAISRQAKVNKFSLVFWLNEIVAIN